MSNNTGWENQQQYIESVRLRHEEGYRRTGKKPMAYLRTYGCQQNVSDGEKLGGMLARMGYGFCDLPEEADLALFNTCAIRENAENRIFGNVGALRRAKRANPGMIVAVCGCMVQQPHIADKLKKSYPYVDLVFGTHALPQLPRLLSQKLAEGGRVFVTEDSRGEIVEGLPLRREGTVKAWLPIMYGCDNFCTYCVVPMVRGRERSRQPEQILTEAQSLIQEGFKEITLLGQNVNSYGKTLETPITFSALLRRICDRVPGKYRLRFMTSHPKDCTRELIDTIAETPNLCGHIHLPVQSGSDRILAAMNRRYTSAEYLALIDYAKKKIPGVSFTSDIIVGFPGETEEDFQDTLRLVEEVSYHALFTFLYSRRRGTKAAELEDATPQQVKSERFSRLLELQQKIGGAKHRELVGQTVEVLVDSLARNGEGILSGRTASGVIVDFPGPLRWMGQFVQVQVTEAMHSAVRGKGIE